MFVNNSALDVDSRASYGSNGSRPSTSGLSGGRYGGNRGSATYDSLAADMTSMALRDVVDDDEDDGIPGSGSANSRARMLAQQREIQLKKRQSSAAAGGMMRSSIDETTGKSPAKPGTDSQYTPAVRQFSAPKSLASESSDAPSEFGQRRKTNYQADENEPEVAARRRPPPSGVARRSYVEDDDNDDDYVERRGSARSAPQRGRRDDDSGDEDYIRGGRGDRDRRTSSSNRPRDQRYDGSDRDDDLPRRPSAAPRGRRELEDDEDDHRQSRRGDRDDDRRPSKRDPRDEEEEESRAKWTASNSTSGFSSSTRGASDQAGEAQSRPMPAPAPLNLTNMKAFLTNPLSKSVGVVQCYVRRVKGSTTLFPTYNLYLKEGDRFLLTSRKQPNNKTSNYHISMAENDLARESGNYLGKLRSNFVGTEFQIFDNGVNPKESGAHETNVRKDLGVVMYAANVLGSRGPRKMQVALPPVDENDRIVTWRSGFRSAPNDDMLTRIKDRNCRDLVYLINKPPRWNEQVGAYVLNFNGRVTMASVKNFQLVDPEDLNSIVLQFGRVAKDEFSMDMQWPISPLQAFAITMSSFDSKIACD